MKLFEFIFKNRFSGMIEFCRVQAADKKKALQEFEDAVFQSSYSSMREIEHAIY